MQSITKYFNLSERQKEQFETLGTLYPEWNEKINVISRKDIDNLYVNHILHSLSIAKFINPVDGTRILDMGTGGGFPGIPLAVMFPKCHFHLIDRIGKKINVARNIADSIKLDNVTFQHGDIAECRDKYDFVVSRAVMRLDGLLPLIKANIDKVQRNGYPNGLICLKGGDLNDETKSIQNPVIVEDINRWFDEPFFDTKKLVYVQM
ncbi:MAG TPA: 16S rRNA (guanine(527)-N(7))-methyltransferase RsmG [Muribaculum sp.]|jgi:16S rRNA (guanine527-N7)-methyltransferase|uniref:Ribosomal RNA small subunit methyltransferase G n=1 Tax=Heminiphilus faecis TaxID=2601703 RepID=A0ABV4CSR2_9BACT|nr:16S rRNA (guanine(527)-N(7))-methyltransferase RsmG [Heminiphilus faecis]RLT77621.1 16S rRNA (guanine(527)-N(7))-methyltransferase RsmG [bacterium J10(2018)]HRF67941.1 16S rRNA (guanine(527)-N(7))-methyltransferase RsmG [Muribaculum sp.]